MRRCSMRCRFGFGIGSGGRGPGGRRTVGRRSAAVNGRDAARPSPDIAVFLTESGKILMLIGDSSRHRSESCPAMAHHRLVIAAVIGALALTGCSSASTTSRSEEHTSELQSLMRISYAVFCL